MGSHYIPVGKIKIDKDILDIVCPAAGYDETPPPPEIYCPANGYIQEPGQPYVPPVEIGVPSENEIFILLTHTIVTRFGMKVWCVGSQWYWELYTASGDFIEKSANINSGYTGTYQYNGVENALYIIKIKLDGVANITQFQFAAVAGYENTVLLVKMNTPAIAALNSAFSATKSLKNVVFESSVDNLTTLQSAFYQSGIEYWKPSKNFSALINMLKIFQQSKIQIADFSDSLFPVLDNFSYGFDNTPDAYRVKFPASFPLLTNASYLFSATGVKHIEMFTHAPSVLNYTQFIYNAPNLVGTLEIPEAQNCTTLRSAIRTTKLKSIALKGNWLALTEVRYLCYENKLLEYMEFPRQMGSATSTFEVDQTMISNVPELLEVVFPDLWFFSKIYANVPFGALSSKMKVVRGAMENGLGVHMSFTTGNLNYSANLEVFDIPKACFIRLYLGGSANAKKLTHLDVDWANSPWEVIPSGNNMTIRLWCAIGTNELNRIYTALPVVSGVGLFKLQVSSNPGYAASDPTIAEAKGWTII